MRNYFEFEGFNDDFLIEINSSNIEDKSSFESEDKSSFAATVIAKAVGDVAQGVGNVAMASANKKQAEAKIVEIGGKRTAQLKDCDTNKAMRFRWNPNIERKRRDECRVEVKKRLDAEEQEQREIVRRMTAIEEGKIFSDLDKSKSVIEEKKAGKKLYVIAGIVGLVLVLGTIVLIKTKK
jgi:hypothetical protein